MAGELAAILQPWQTGLTDLLCAVLNSAGSPITGGSAVACSESGSTTAYARYVGNMPGSTPAQLLQLSFSSAASGGIVFQTPLMAWGGSTFVIQTGDSYSIVNNGTYGNNALNDSLVNIDTEVDAIQTALTNGTLVLAGTQTFNNTGNLIGTVTNPVTLTGAYDAAKSAASQSSVNTLSTNVGAAGAGLTSIGDARLSNLDNTISSRMATYTQPTGFLAANFNNYALASQIPANFTPALFSSAGVFSVGALANAPITSLGTNAPIGWINSAAIAENALNGKGDWFTAGGYTAPDNVTIGNIYSRIGVNGAGLTALGDTRLNYLNASISSISASVWAYVTRTLSTNPPTAGEIATSVWSAGGRTLTGFGTLIEDIWGYTVRLVTNTIPTSSQNAIAIADLQLTGHTTAGSAGAAWNNSGSSANPWAATASDLATYPAGSAGNAQWRLGQTPGSGPIAPIPAPASAGECIAYINNIPLPGIDMAGSKIYISPSIKPAGAGDFIIDPGNIGKIALIVNDSGYAAITLPVDQTSGTSYHFECDRLGINNDAVLTHGVFDIATFIANPA